MAKSQKIRDLREGDRPREKLLAKGAEALSDQELLAILLGKGTAEMDVMTMAGKILDVLSKNGEEPVSMNCRKLKEWVWPVPLLWLQPWSFPVVASAPRG